MDANAAFAARFGFPFPLLCDTGRDLCRAYGACDPSDGLPCRRITFIIGADGRILEAYGEVDPRSHAQEVLETCARAARGVSSAAAACGLVYAVGQLGYDVAGPARHASFVQQGVAKPRDAGRLLERLREAPWEAAAIHWTLVQDRVPLYVIEPHGGFAAKGYELLRECLAGQIAGTVERVSIAGRLTGSARLAGGATLPVVRPELRGLFRWTAPGAGDGELRNLLSRLFDELRTPGRAPRERAVNYAAATVFRTGSALRSALAEGLAFGGMATERSAFCRPGSDCHDVAFTFFSPVRRQAHPRTVVRVTVDVGDVVPVSIGPPRRWRES